MPPAVAVARRRDKKQRRLNSVSVPLLRPESGIVTETLLKTGGDIAVGKLTLSMLASWSHGSTDKPVRQNKPASLSWHLPDSRLARDLQYLYY